VVAALRPDTDFVAVDVKYGRVIDPLLHLVENELPLEMEEIPGKEEVVRLEIVGRRRSLRPDRMPGEIRPAHASVTKRGRREHSQAGRAALLFPAHVQVDQIRQEFLV